MRAAPCTAGTPARTAGEATAPGKTATGPTRQDCGDHAVVLPGVLGPAPLSAVRRLRSLQRMLRGLPASAGRGLAARTGLVP